MRNFKNLVYIFILGFTSCIPYKKIDIQYIKEPVIKISPNFNKPLILINSYQNKRNNKKDRFEYAIDSLASEEAAISLKENLQKSPLFEGFDISIQRYQRMDSSRYIKPLAWSTVNSIANKDSVDLIISLEYIKIMELTDSYKIIENQVECFYGYLKVPLYCYWRVYDTQKKQILNGFLYRDTLIWDTTDWTPVTVGNQLPGFFNASAYAGSDCGEKYAQKIAPVWSDDKRIFFHKGSKEMEKASEYVVKEQWIEAAIEWQKVFTLKNRILNAKAAFNLALANEMLGKFDLSLEWLIKAKKYYPLSEIEDYQSTVKERIANKIK
ncbi:MAG: hypothetical protein HXX16_06075 [Bacteroidales bacterium]|nr:hypothetical protein [Bacteroidales bacterium]